MKAELLNQVASSPLEKTKDRELFTLSNSPLELTQLKVSKSIQADSIKTNRPIITSLITSQNFQTGLTSVSKLKNTELGMSQDIPGVIADTITDIDQSHYVLPKYESSQLDNQDITKQFSQNQNQANEIAFISFYEKHFLAMNSKPLKPTSKTNSTTKLSQIGYWQTVHSIESKQGKLMYRPRNKSRSCTYTPGPCGHHQLTAQALKDIGCGSKQCRKDRLNYKKSLNLSKKLLALNEQRLEKNGITKLQGYQKYLIHQQGATGIKNILAATKGKKELSKIIKKNMANNSPFSYKQLKRMGSKVAAKRFMQHWEDKWISEKRLIVASQAIRTTDNQKNTDFVPTFNESELYLAFNTKF